MFQCFCEVEKHTQTQTQTHTHTLTHSLTHALTHSLTHSHSTDNTKQPPKEYKTLTSPASPFLDAVLRLLQVGVWFSVVLPGALFCLFMVFLFSRSRLMHVFSHGPVNDQQFPAKGPGPCWPSRPRGEPRPLGGKPGTPICRAPSFVPVCQLQTEERMAIIR